nr:acetylcholinesterase-like [Aedes albopictus]
MLEFLLSIVAAAIALAKFIISGKLLKIFPPPVRPIVEVSQGKLRGVTTTLPNGSTYHYFKGVPYAKPPVGELRFRPPVPVEKFYKPVVDCLVDRSVCMQPMGRFVVGKEAGLYLNVFTPGLSVGEVSAAPKFPVMVWIHGGAFMSGSSNSFVYNPLHLVEEGVVVVTLNYRLGALGFLSLPSAGITGNAGLKDQLLVFKWVKQNISRFGGDSENITIFGESAGSMSAYLHYLSPNSRKYFHKVICQSGVACSESFFQVDAANKARKLAKVFGYDGNDDSKVLETLLKTPAKMLIKHQDDVATDFEKRLALQMFFRPVIEEAISEDSIITESPEKIFKSFDTIRMPLINGCTDSEGILGIWFIRKRLKDFVQNPESLVPQLLGSPPGLDKKTVGKEIQQFYFGNDPLGNESLDALCNVMSDNIFVTNTNVSAEWIAKYQPNVKHYHYRFCCDGKLNFTKKMFRLSQVKGASHGDELFYLFQSKFLQQLPESSDEYRVIRTMIRMWTNFAKYSDPTPDSHDPLLPFKWTAVQNFDRNADQFDLDSLKIDVKCEMEKNPCKERMELWRGYFKKYREGHLYDV